MIEGATARAGAVVPLVLRDLRRHRRQLGDLMPGGLGTSRPSVRRQRPVAAFAPAGDEGDDVLGPLTGQAPTQAGAVAGLAAGLLAGGSLGDALGGAGRARGGRGGGVGGVAARARLDVAALRLQFSHPLLQLPDARVALLTA